MATRTRKPVRVTFKSKSEEALALLKGTHPEVLTGALTISDTSKWMTANGRDMGYTFVYGVAKRNGLATTAANRRPVKNIVKDKNGTVTVQVACSHHSAVVIRPDGTITAGNLTINPDGSIAKARARRSS